jgi:hypothetical protein
LIVEPGGRLMEYDEPDGPALDYAAQDVSSLESSGWRLTYQLQKLRIRYSSARHPEYVSLTPLTLG